MQKEVTLSLPRLHLALELCQNSIQSWSVLSEVGVQNGLGTANKLADRTTLIALRGHPDFPRKRDDEVGQMRHGKAHTPIGDTRPFHAD